MTKPTDPQDTSKFSDTALWRQAIKVCESLSGLPREQVLAELRAMELAPELLQKIQRIMQNMSASNPLLDQHDYQSLIESLKQGNHLIGQTIDGYLIKKLIAKGGMSTVYEAEFIKAKHQKTVAIKLLSPYGITPKAIELFNREQLILSKLSHPSIVAFHHSGLTSDGTHYLVMECIDDAENLVDYVAKHKLSVQAVVKRIKDLCEVFAYAHEKQVIHRDIKTANILVDSNGQTKVIDFGIGRLEQLEGQTVTQVFTPDAAAPEQLLGQGVSVQTDVFSLGALLLQSLIQTKPLPKTNFKNYDPEDDVKYVHTVLKKSTLDNDLKNIITTAMHIDPKLRYSDMHAFAEDLSNWMSHKPVNATKDSLIYRCTKYYLRNKTLTVLVTLGLLISLSAITFITTLEFKNQKVTSQRDGSFALIEAMIDQANPTTHNNQEVDGDAMVKSLDKLAKNQAHLLASDHQLSHFFYHKLGILYNSKGLYQEALDNYQKALSSLKQYTDEDDEALIARELTTAHLLETTGNFKQAQFIGETVLKKLAQLPKLNPKHRLNVYYLLAKVHQYQANNEQSKLYGQLAIEWMNLYPAIDPEMQATMYNSLAVTNRNMGDVKTAEQQYHKAIELLRPIRAKRIELASILVNLAILKGRAGDLVTSEVLFNESFELIKSVDEDHPNLAVNYLPYTTLLQLTGRLNESQSILEQAIEIFETNKQSKHLASAYIKYARTGLFLNDVDLALVNILKSFLLYKDITGLDHPQTLDLYNMALWVMLQEPYQADGLQLVEIVDGITVENAIESKEYQRFLVQKAWLNKSAIDIDFAEAVIPNYLFDQSNKSKQSKQTWLTEMQAIYTGDSDVVDAWLAVNLALIKKDAAAIKQLCDHTLDWFESSRLAIKVLIAQQCLNSEAAVLPPSQSAFEQLLHVTTQANERTSRLINELLKFMQ